jgi:hypothetical protein
VSHS